MDSPLLETESLSQAIRNLIRTLGPGASLPFMLRLLMRRPDRKLPEIMRTLRLLEDCREVSIDAGGVYHNGELPISAAPELVLTSPDPTYCQPAFDL